MKTLLAVPAASDPAEIQADWLELLALSKKDRNSSLEDLVREHRKTGSTDALDAEDTDEEVSTSELVDAGSEKSQMVAELAFGELSDRAEICGGHPAGYPFIVAERYIEARQRFTESIYTFLLALSFFGKDAGPSDVDAIDLFDRVCAAAAEEYFGGADRGASSYLFGFPRRVTPAGFRAALDDLCNKLGEGGGCKTRPTTSNQNDGELDIVAWRSFGDGRSGKMIGLGQCATGKNWNSKVNVLHNFCKLWMNDQPIVDPLRMFFVPRRVERDVWDTIGLKAGILFDRCRITALTWRLDEKVLSSCAKWTRYVLKANLG